jgi:hypothetical protein
MSALCQKRTHAPQHTPAKNRFIKSLVGAEQHRWHLVAVLRWILGSCAIASPNRLPPFRYMR